MILPDDLFNDLLSDLQETEYWTPKEAGDVLIGEVVEIGEGVNPYNGEVIPRYTIEDREGKRWLVQPTRKVLAAELANAKPNVGDVIGIKYLGFRQRASGGYHNYKVKVVQVPADNTAPTDSNKG